MRSLCIPQKCHKYDPLKQNRFLRLAPCFLAIALILTLISPVFAKDAPFLFQTALEQYSEKNYAAAIESLEIIRKTVPDYQTLLGPSAVEYWLGKSYYKQGHYGNAGKFLGLVNAGSKDYPEAQDLISRILKSREEQAHFAQLLLKGKNRLLAGFQEQGWVLNSDSILTPKEREQLKEQLVRYGNEWNVEGIQHQIKQVFQSISHVSTLRKEENLIVVMPLVSYEVNPRIISDKLIRLIPGYISKNVRSISLLWYNSDFQTHQLVYSKSSANGFFSLTLYTLDQQLMNPAQLTPENLNQLIQFRRKLFYL